MKKIITTMFILMYSISTLAIPLSASEVSTKKVTENMAEDKWYYSEQFLPVNGYAFAKLSNREDLYAGTNFTGDGEVQLRRIDVGYDNTQCTNYKNGLAAKEYVECGKTGLSDSHTHQARGLWSTIYGGDYIYASIE